MKISLLNLDVDLYNSYKTCLEELYDKVIDGGIVCFDEYQSDKWTGAKKAIDDFAKIKNIEVHIDTLSGQAFFKIKNNYNFFIIISFGYFKKLLLFIYDKKLVVAKSSKL